jgi:class 3 adenylate cyclase
MAKGPLDQLRTARGESCHVLVAFMDVRGFSSFARVAESTDSALFLRAMYTKVLDNYFKGFTFFKPTGDGLMIVREVSEDVKSVTDGFHEWTCQARILVSDFPTLTAEDILINVQVPERVGIGIARGSATRLTSDDGETLDYSGRCLNLAARLMDLARPEGVVVHDRHANALLGEELASEMTNLDVYVKGVSELDPVNIYFDSDRVIIPDGNKRPLSPEPLFDEPEQIHARELFGKTGSYLVSMSHKPRPGAKILVAAECPVCDEEGKPKIGNMTSRLDAEAVQEPDGYYAKIDLAELQGIMTMANLTPNSECVVRLTALY